MTSKPAPQLKPHHFKPGNPGGPGRPKNWLTPQELKDVVGRYMKMTRAQHKAKMDDPEATVLEVIVGRIIAVSMKTGDANKFEMLLNRTVGKIREELILDDNGKPLALIHRPDGTTFEIINLKSEQKSNEQEA